MRELEGVQEVTIRLSDRVLVFENPQVSLIEVQGARIYQVVGNPVERPVEEEGAVEISEEDVQLVASEAGVSPEEARQALVETGGDLAQAIILLKLRKEGG